MGEGCRQGKLITFEGPDGCGKTTQLVLLKKALEAEGQPVFVTREPGGTKTGRKLREIVLDARNVGLSERAELFLYLADRAQHAEEVVAPALKTGKIVLADRYLDSTWVYQGIGRRFPLEFVEACNAFAVSGVMPDLTIVFDVSTEIGLARSGNRGAPDRMENQALAFHRRVRTGFLRLQKRFGDRVIVLNASGTPAQIHAQVRVVLREKLGF